MESRLLYKTTNSIKVDYNDWIHFGTEQDIDIKLVDSTISEFFNDTSIYLVFERTNSGAFDAELFHSILGKKNFFLWDMELSKTIEFKNIGVLRTGIKA